MLRYDYRPACSRGCCGWEFVEDPNGDYVKYDDIIPDYKSFYESIKDKAETLVKMLDKQYTLVNLSLQENQIVINYTYVYGLGLHAPFSVSYEELENPNYDEIIENYKIKNKKFQESAVCKSCGNLNHKIWLP